MSKTHETLHHKTHKHKDDKPEEKQDGLTLPEGVTPLDIQNEVVAMHKKLEVTSALIGVSSLFDNEWHYGLIEISENKVVDFFSGKWIKVKTALEVPGFPSIEFKKLAFQKSKSDFSYMPHYSDGLISAEELKEYL